MNIRIGLGVVATVLAARHARAQDTSPTVGRWAVGSELGFNAARGNSSYTMLTSGLRFTHLDKNQFELDWASTLTYGESDAKVIARRMVSTVKGDFHPHATWSPFVFGSIERDRIRRIDVLANTGAGIKWTFFRNKPGAASLSLAGLYSYRETEPVSATVIEPPQRTIRMSLRPKVVQRLSSGFSFEHTSFWQPDVQNPSDYNLDASTRLGYSPTKVTTLFAQYTYRVDSRPPDGVKREDQLMLAGIKLQF